MIKKALKVAKSRFNNQKKKTGAYIRKGLRRMSCKSLYLLGASRANDLFGKKRDSGQRGPAECNGADRRPLARVNLVKKVFCYPVIKDAHLHSRSRQIPPSTYPT